MSLDHLEGRISILAALGARRRRFQVVLVSDRAHPEKVAEVLAAAERNGVPVKRVPPEELDAMAQGVTHGGVIGVCTARAPDPEEALFRAIDAATGPPCLLLLEGIEDAQNLGYTLRSAAALGVDAVLLKKHVWDFDAGAVARASSGAFEALPLVKVDQGGALLDRLRRGGVCLLGCIAGARRTLYEADLRGPVLLAIGGEKRGLSAVVRDRCDRLVRIPMRPGATSLSLSHAAAVLMAEVMRQRTAAAPPDAAPAPSPEEPPAG